MSNCEVFVDLFALKLCHNTSNHIFLIWLLNFAACHQNHARMGLALHPQVKFDSFSLKSSQAALCTDAVVLIHSHVHTIVGVEDIDSCVYPTRYL